MKWTAVRYKAKPEQADENQRLSEAVFQELKEKAPQGIAYLVLRLDDGTFVHVAAVEDGAEPVSGFKSFKEFRGGVAARSLEQPVVTDASLVGRYWRLS
jgi:hypothetical protein